MVNYILALLEANLPPGYLFFNLKESSIQSLAGSRRKRFLYNTKSEVSVSDGMLTEKCRK